MKEIIDPQIIELLGRNKLISEILRSGLEVSIPVRDRGIDLIAYTDISDRTDKFIAKPIQMKASLRESIIVDKKYSKIKDLIIVYIWNIEDEKKCVAYALNYEEAYKVAEEMGWTKTPSWEEGRYSTSKPSKKLKKVLKPYKMDPEKWWKKIIEYTFDIKQDF